MNSTHLHGDDLMELTRDDLRESTRELKNYIGERVGGVEAQLKELNGQTRRHGEALAAHHERLKNIELDAVSPRKTTTTTTTRIQEDQRPAITRRDLKLLCYVGGGLVALVEFAHRVFDFMSKVAAP